MVEAVSYFFQQDREVGFTYKDKMYGCKYWAILLENLTNPVVAVPSDFDGWYR